MKNPFSSTNIADLLQAQIDVIGKVNDVLVSSKIDENTMKDIAKRIKPITDTIKSLVEIANEMAKLKISSVIGNAKFALLVDALVHNIKTISEELSSTEVDPKITEKTKVLCDSIKHVLEIAVSLREIGKSALLLIVMKPAINAVINIIISIAKKIDENANVITNLNKNAEILGKGIITLAQGIAMFTLFTLGGLVPLVGVIALLSVKLFLSIFFLLFNETTVDKIKISLEAINEIAKTMLILSMTVLIWALTGLLIQEEWKNLLIVATFVLVAIGLFMLLGFLQQFIKNGTDSLLMIAKVFVIISLTVVLWALTGLLIQEEWENILIVATFVLVAIGLFILLGFASKYIEQGTKEMITIALTLVILSLTVVLWAATGDYVLSNFGAVLIMLVFVGITILMFYLLSKSTKDIIIGGVALMLLSAALIILGFSVMLYVIAGKMLIDNLLAVGAVMLFLALVIGICVLLSYTIQFIIIGIAGLILLSSGLLVFSVALLLLIVAARLITLDDILTLVASMTALGVGVAALGFIMPLIVIGSIALGILGAALIIFMVPLLMFAGVVAAFKAVDVTEEDVTHPISLMGALVSAINNTFGIKETIAITMAIPKIMMLVPIAAAVGLIAKIIQQIASLSIPVAFDKDGNGKEFVKMTGKDFTEAAANAAGMISILAGIFGEEDIDVVIGGENIKIKPMSKSALEGITFSAIIKMKMLNSIVESIGEMANVLSNLASLTVPDETKGFDKNGKPKGWHKMTKEDFTMACENIATIMVTLLSSMTEYKAQSLGGRTVMDAIDEMSRAAINKLALVFDVFGNMDKIVNVIQQMANMSVPTKFDKDGKPIAFKHITEEERKKAIENAVLLMTEFLKAITDPALSEQLENMDSDAIENFERVMNSATGISSLINIIGKALEFDKDKIATGIGNIRSAIVQYSKMVSDLFYEKWELIWKTKNILGINLPYPTWKVVDKAEIDINKMEDAIGGMEEIGKTIEPIQNLLDSINSIISNENANKMEDGVSLLSNIITKYAQSITGNEKGEGGIIISEEGTKRISRFILLINTTDKFAKINSANLQKNTDTFIKFIDKANSINTDKIKSIRDMFEQIARFSESIKGNFDKLADVLSEKLVDVLANINETIGNINSNKSGNNISSNNAVNTNTSAQETKRNVEQMNKLVSIADSLEDILSVLKEVRENTDYQYKI